MKGARACGQPRSCSEQEREGVVNPLLWISLHIIFTFDGHVAQEAIWAVMLLCGDMSKVEVEEVDSGYPPVDHGVGLAVQIVEHAVDE